MLAASKVIKVQMHQKLPQQCVAKYFAILSIKSYGTIRDKIDLMFFGQLMSLGQHWKSSQLLSNQLPNVTVSNPFSIPLWSSLNESFALLLVFQQIRAV